MKMRKSNIIFFSYLGVIFLIGLGIMIYARTLISSGEFLKENVNIEYGNDKLKSIESFDVVYLKNTQLEMIQSDSFAVDIPDSSMILRNDTLFVENCNSAVILYKEVSEINLEESSDLNIVSANNDELIIKGSNSEINIAAVDFNKLILISKGDCEINVTSSKINVVDVDFIGENEVDFLAKVDVLQGNNSDETEITILPKPKKIKLNGNTKLNK